MKCTIVSPRKLLFHKTIKSLVLPALDGKIGIEKNHAPMIVVLAQGIVRILVEEENYETVAITGGFAQVADNAVVLAVQQNAS